MTKANPPAVPISTSKTAALSRVLDVVPKGYTYYTAGTVPARKLLPLLNKLHAKYAIGASPAQRILRKKKGQANALMVVYVRPIASNREADSPPEPSPTWRQSDLQSILQTDTEISWLLLATKGSGPVWDEERLQDVRQKHRLTWLGYELVRHEARGRAAWTWRRPKAEMEALYALLGEQLRQHHHVAVTETLLRISRQPGFAGVRQQSAELCRYARGNGYTGELPFLFHVQKVGQGERVQLLGGG
jgi:hypothetical protein